MPRLFRALALFALLLGAVAPPARADAAFTPMQRAEIVQIVRQALQQDPSILRDAIAALQEDDARQQAASAMAHGAELVRPNDPVAGNPHGAVTIVEFFDVRCPYCREMNGVLGHLLRREPDVRVVFKDLPVLGPSSRLASTALLAAERQGGYLKLRAALMAASPDITAATIRAAAVQVGLNWPRLARDMKDPAIGRRLDANLALAKTLGIDGTPTFIVGHEFIPGAIDLAAMEKAVAAARAKG